MSEQCSQKEDTMTNPTESLYVVLGAGGSAGNAIVHALVAGHGVRAVSRGGTATVPDGVEQLAADVTSPEGLAAALQGAAVVYMAAQPSYHRWAEEFPSMLAGVIDGVAAEGAKLIMVDNLYMYGEGETTMTEGSPERGGTKKGDVRVEMSQMLREAHQTGRARVVIGRASDYFGPGAGNSAITALAVEPAAAGKTIRWLGRLDRRHSAAYLPDIARAYVTLGEESKAEGETWILPHGPAPTGAEFLAAVNAVLAAPVKTGSVGKAVLRVAAPFHKISKESLEIAYQWTDDFVADDAKFQRVFGPFHVTPLAEAVKTTMEWYMQQR